MRQSAADQGEFATQEARAVHKLPPGGDRDSAVRAGSVDATDQYRDDGTFTRHVHVLGVVRRREATDVV